jgi:hypothetical protein
VIEMDDLQVIAVTSFISFIILFLVIYDLYAHRRAFNSLREILWRVLIPFLFSVFYVGIFLFTQWNVWSLLIIVQFLGNFFIAALMWNTEVFLGQHMNLDKKGRIILFLYNQFEEDESYEVTLYEDTDQKAYIKTLIEWIDKDKIYEREKKQFENEDEWLYYLEKKKNFEALKKSIIDKRVSWNLNVYFFYNYAELIERRGFKICYFINHNGLANHKLEGNAVRLKEKLKIGYKKFEKIVVWEGFKDKALSNMLEESKGVLDCLAHYNRLEEIPILEAENKKLHDLLEKYKKGIENMEDEVVLAKDALEYAGFTSSPSKTPQAPSMKWLAISLLMLCLMISIFLILSVLGFL